MSTSFESRDSSEPYMRVMILPGEVLSPEEVALHEAIPSSQEEAEFQRGLNAIRDAEKSAWIEGDTIRIE